MLSVLAEVFAQLGDFLAPQSGIDREERRERLPAALLAELSTTEQRLG